MENVIAAAELAGPLDGQHIERLLDHADADRRRGGDRRRSGSTPASVMLKQTLQYATLSLMATSAAARARASSVERAEDVVRESLGRLRADPG